MQAACFYEFFGLPVKGLAGGVRHRDDAPHFASLASHGHPNVLLGRQMSIKDERTQESKVKLKDTFLLTFNKRSTMIMGYIVMMVMVAMRRGRQQRIVDCL